MVTHISALAKLDVDVTISNLFLFHFRSGNGVVDSVFRKTPTGFCHIFALFWSKMNTTKSDLFIFIDMGVNLGLEFS